ncbi:helix-turn-helix domain-containing protein, partial [Candidatus Parcubacteria bacterium]|nr:helix-turn-helix domain-containing protein [Candidatus Parcubacteria bacterium]
RWVDTGDLRVARIGRKTYRVFESDLRKFIRKYM